MFLRFDRRAWALAGRLPWLAFLSFRCVLAMKPVSRLLLVFAEFTV